MRHQNNHEGPHILIKEGAKICTDPKDILGDLPRTSRSSQSQPDLEAEELTIYNAIRHEACDLNTLSYRTQMTVAVLLPLISDLELKGYVMKTPDGRYDISS